MRASGLTTKQLRYFVHVVNVGSINRAAADLRVAQTALGLQIRALEAALSAQLLERHHRGVRPTKIGRFVFERARQVLHDIDDLAEEVDARVRKAGREIRVGLVPSMMRAIGTRAVLHEREYLPGIHLHLVENMRSELIADLRQERLDYIIVQDAPHDAGLHTVPVLRQELVLVSTPGRAGVREGPVRFRDAIAAPLVLRGTQSWVHELVYRRAAELGLDPNIAFEIGSLPSILEIIRSGEAASIMTEDMIAEDVAGGLVTVHPIVEPVVDLVIEIATLDHAAPNPDDRAALGYLDSLLGEFCARHGFGRRILGRFAGALTPPVPETSAAC